MSARARIDSGREGMRFERESRWPFELSRCRACFYGDGALVMASCLETKFPCSILGVCCCSEFFS